MADITDFTSWFLVNIPTFLMSEPICYFVGLGFLAWTIHIIHLIKSI